MKLRTAIDTERRQEKRGRKWHVTPLGGELIGPLDCPIMRRWFVETPLGSIRLHHFLRPDDDRHLHDHPWSFLTFVVKGGYTDVGECWGCDGRGITFLGRRCNLCRATGRLEDRLGLFSVRLRPAEHRHMVVTDGAWTIIVTGPVRRVWGFWDAGVFRPMREYFKRYGYAACQDPTEGA